MNDERLSPEEYLQKLQAAMDEEVEEAAKQEEPQDVQEKKSKTKRKTGKRKKKHYFLRFVIFIVVIAGIVYTLQSSLFYVQNIEVSGNRFYTKAQVVDMSELETGKNLLFETKLRPARDKLLASPYIKFVTLKRIPLSTIQIDVTERIEYAAIPTKAGYVLIDDEGYVLSVSDKEPTLPLLEGMNIISMEIGSPLQIEQAYLLTDTLNLLKTINNTDLFFKRIYFSTVLVKAYINDNYYCEGSPLEIKNGIDGIRRLIEEHYKQGIDKGVIVVGSDGYFSYNPKID